MFGALKVFSTHSRAAVVTWEVGCNFASFHLPMGACFWRFTFCLFSPWCADIFSAFWISSFLLTLWGYSPFPALSWWRARETWVLEKKASCFKQNQGTMVEAALQVPHPAPSPTWSLPGEDHLFPPGLPHCLFCESGCRTGSLQWKSRACSCCNQLQCQNFTVAKVISTSWEISEHQTTGI